MRNTYKLEKSFGSVASFSGILVFIAGLIATYFALTGLILVFFGAFIGLLIDMSKPFYTNKKGNIILCGGLQEDFQIKLERGFEGASGVTIRNGLHLTFGPRFSFLKSNKLFSTIKIFGGWSYTSTNGEIDNSELYINRSYSDSYHYFSRGVFLQAGYEVTSDLCLSLFLKSDFRRLTDGDGILEYPELLYGIGIIKRF